MNPVALSFKKIIAGFRSPRSGEPSPRFRVINLTRNVPLATSVELATTSGKRSKGLLGRSGLGPGEGLWIAPCESVHTFGMRFAIDLVYLDKQHRIRKIRRSVPPWRISGCLTAHSVLELAAGAVREEDAHPGDHVALVAIGSKEQA